MTAARWVNASERAHVIYAAAPLLLQAGGVELDVVLDERGDKVVRVVVALPLVERHRDASGGASCGKSVSAATAGNVRTGRKVLRQQLSILVEPIP